MSRHLYQRHRNGCKREHRVFHQKKKRKQNEHQNRNYKHQINNCFSSISKMPQPSPKTRKKKAAEVEEDESFIPVNIIDHASQRVFLVSIFVLIQSWKVYDMILVRTDSLSTANLELTTLNHFTFVLKYVVIDGLFLWLLPILNIPYLTFSPFVTLLLTLVINALTLVLASNFTIPLFANFVIPIWKIVFNKKELTIVGDSVSSNNVVDMNAHFKGRYTIQYLPDSSARFNPFHFDKMCLNPSASVVNMPIEVNTTTQLGFLQIEHVLPNNEINYINYTKSDLNRLRRRDYTHLQAFPQYEKSDPRVFYLEVKIGSPGKYRISKVTDSEGTIIRTYKSEFQIANCPGAEFVYPVALTDKYKCIGKGEDDHRIDLPLVKASGVAPLTLEFALSINGNKLYAFNKTVDTELNKLANIGHTQDEIFTRNLLEQELLKNPSLLLSRAPGNLQFQLVGITDYFGNSNKYNPLSKDKDVWYEIELKKEFQVQLVDPRKNQPLLLNSSKTLSIDSNTVPNDFPLLVHVRFESNKNLVLSYNYTHEFKNKQELQAGFPVELPGKYLIISAKTKYCPCEVVPSELVFDVVPPPDVEIKAEPIVDKCIGMVGYEFDFEFEGHPPFLVQYQVLKRISENNLRPVLNEQGRSTRVLKSLDKKFTYNYKPPAEGNYVIVFKNLKDDFYNQKPVILDESKHTYETYFKHRSTISFFENKNSLTKHVNLCAEESTRIPVYFKGNSPFSFVYEIVDTNTQEVLTQEKIKNWEANTYTIETPQFVKGGKFKVVLKEAIDSLGCEVEFNARETVTINTRADVPEIEFGSSESKIQIVRGDSVKLPLKLQSSQGFTSSDELTFQIQDLHDSKKIRQNVIRNLNNFRAKDEGVYSLVSFTNGGCLGKVKQSQQKITISYLPEPKLKVLSDSVLKQHLEENDISLHLKPLCQGSHSKINLNLEGSGPFLIDYELRSPDNNRISRSLTIENVNKELNLPTTMSGRYELLFKKVYDKHYTQQKVSQLNDYGHTLPIVRYDILGLPNAEIFEDNSFVQICETKLKEIALIQPIPVKLTGQYPFTIKASIQYGLEGKSHQFLLKDINEPYLNLKEAKTADGADSLPILDKLFIGEHLISLHEITDGNGCVRQNIVTKNKYIVGVTESPGITKLSTHKHYCVGDHIAYNISGVSPFIVFYKFNDKLQKADVESKFYRLASKAGLLEVVALQDSSSNACLVNYTTDAQAYEALKLKIYDLPSVEVSQGENIIRSLHEGDQTEITFSFEGTPPFYLKYVRYSNEDPKEKNKRKAKAIPRKITDVKVVEDIWDHEYSIMASLEGTYEAVEVRDAYCRATRDDVDV